MALPAILRAASSIKSGSDRLIVASRLNKVAGSSIVKGLAHATGAAKVPGLDRAGSYISRVRDRNSPSSPSEKRQKRLPSTPTQTSTQRNQEKAREDAQKNKDRQDKAEKEAVDGNDENVSLLKVIAKETTRVRDAVELLVKKSGEKAEEGKSLLGGLMSSITGMLPALLGGAGKGILGRILGRATGAAARIGGSLLSKGKGLLGIGAGVAAAGTVRAAAPTAAAPLGRHALRDPATGRFVSRAATAAPAGVVGRGALAAGAGGTAASTIATKGGGALGRGVAKAAGKSLIKKIPIIGAIAGLGFAANRAMAGDWTGAGMEAASGLAGTVPGLGTAASLGIDAALLARDVKRSQASSGTPTTAPTPPVVAASAAQRRPAPAPVATMSVHSILSKMLDEMTDEHKGIFTRPAKDGGSTLASLVGSPSPGTSYTSPSSVDTSRIGPTTAGIGGSTTGMSMHAPGSDGLGSLSAHYESGSRGSSAVGWDSTGGTSYGKYQIASRTGTMKKFMSYLKESNPAAYERLAAAGDADGGKDGTFAQTWKQMAKDGSLGTSEHDFIKKTHYDVGYGKIKNEGLRGMVGKSSSLQDVLWSTSVQHGGGGAGGIFNKVYKDGMSEEDLIKAVYAERGTRFGSSTSKVRASVQNRFEDESKRALAAVGTSPTGMVRDAAAARHQNRTAPVVVHAPQQMVAQAGKGANQRSTPSSTPVMVRNPDSPVRANVNTLIRTT